METPPAQPQRKSKRRRNRNRNRKRRNVSPQEVDHNEVSVEQQQTKSVSLSPSQAQSVESRQTRKRQRQRKKVTISDNLNNLNFNDINNVTKQLNEWLHELSNQDNSQFMTAFMKANGVDIIVEKMIKYIGNIQLSQQQNRMLSNAIVSLFDLMLSGTHEYHEWLYQQIYKLSVDLKKLSSTNTTDDDDNLMEIIKRETRNLVHAQTKRLNNMDEISMCYIIYI